MDAGVALVLQHLHDFGFAEVLGHGDREGDHEARVARRCGAFAQVRVDRLGRIALHRPAAAAAVELRGPREQELDVVVQFRHRAHGGARGADLVGLVDRNRGRDAVDAVHLRLVHAVEELPRVRREGLDVAALSFCIQGIEHQRALARARHAGHHHQLVAGNGYGEVLQVVLPRAENVDGRRGFALLFGFGGVCGGDRAAVGWAHAGMLLARREDNWPRINADKRGRAQINDEMTLRRCPLSSAAKDGSKLTFCLAADEHG